MGGCEAFLNRIGKPIQLFPVTEIQDYGDATGSGRHTSASRTDWQTVRDFFKRHPCQVDCRVPSSNPPVKDRANCVNAMLCNQAGERRLTIHQDCKQFIQDLERVHWRYDANGNMLGRDR